MRVGYWPGSGGRIAFQAPEFSVTGRLFNQEVRLSPEEVLEIVRVLLSNFPSWRERLEEVLKGM